MTQANGVCIRTELLAKELSTQDRKELTRLEDIIRGGLRSFVDVGDALTSIRDNRMYRETHATFENYCQEKWDMQRRYANRLIGAAEVMGTLGPTGPNVPECERQVRPLTKLPPDEQVAAWNEAVEASPNGKPTSAIVEQIVATRLPKTNVPEVTEDEEAPAHAPPALSRGEQEAAEIVGLFHERLARVTDGGVHTINSLSEMFDVGDQSMVEFVRMCEVSPAVKVLRTYGRKGLVQFQFVPTKCVTGHARVRQLAEEIATDPSSGSRSAAAATRILQLLGG